MKALMSQGTPRFGWTLTSGVRRAPARARHPRAQAEGDEPHEPRVDPERLRQLLVHDHRLGDDPDLRPLHHEPHGHAEGHRDQEQHEPVLGVRHAAHADRLCDALSANWISRPK